jgi:hypothetical protein
MRVNPTAQKNVTQEAAHVAQKHRAQHAKKSEETSQAQQQDTVILSQRAQDLAALKSGNTVAEENKESPVVETQEEQAQ